MKKFKLFLLSILASFLFFYGCEQKEIVKQDVIRDNVTVVKQYHFDVDQASQVIYVINLSTNSDDTLKIYDGYISFMLPVRYNINDSTYNYYFEDIKGRDIYITKGDIRWKIINGYELMLEKPEILKYYYK